MENAVFPEFVLFRPLFIVIASALLLLLLVVIWQKRPFVNLFSVLLMSITCSSVATIALYASGYIVDEYNLGGDSVSFLLCIAIIGLSMLNIFVHSFKTMRL